MEKKRSSIASLDILCMLKFVLRNAWMVIMAAVICAMGVYLVQDLLKVPSYSSETTFAVTSRSNQGMATGTIAVTDTVSGQFAELLSSSLVLDAAAKSMGLESFPATVSVYVPKNTNIIRMSIIANSPEIAYKCALALIDVYPSYSTFILSSTVMDTISGPTIPSAPQDAASRAQLQKLSGPLGALVMIGLLVLMGVMRDTVQTVEGAKQQIEGTMLVPIYHERKNQTWKAILKRQKKALLISDPTCSFFYTESIHQLRVRVEYAAQEKNCHSFLVSSYSENEGKSTVAANLALSLAQKHHRVLLLDADLRRPAQARIFDRTVTHGRDLSQALFHHASEEQILDMVEYMEATNLYALFCEPVSSRYTNSLSAEMFRKLLTVLRKQYDYIVVDTAPLGFFADSDVLADATDASILVVRQDAVPAIAINDSIDMLMSAKAQFLGYVFNNIHLMNLSGVPQISYGYGSKHGYGHGYRKSYGYSYGYQKAKTTQEQTKSDGVKVPDAPQAKDKSNGSGKKGGD